MQTFKWYTHLGRLQAIPVKLRASSKLDTKFAKKYANGFKLKKNDRIYVAHLFLRIDHNFTLDAVLADVCPAVSRLPLPLTLRTLELAKASLCSLVRSQTFFAWSCLQNKHKLKTQPIQTSYTLVTLKSGLKVTESHWNWYHSKAWVWFPIRLL